jgi:hypothetical protein
MALVLFCWTPITVHGQEELSPEQPDTEQGTQEPQEPQTPATLEERTRAEDIRTAGFYDLVVWTESLGLSSRGSASEMRTRLYDYYGITPDNRDPSGEQNRKVIVIEAAEETRYFTIEEVDESYIRFSGGVVLVMEDPDNSVIHRISADQIIFNQTRRLLTAHGSIEYVLQRADSEETFAGESVSINLDDPEGVFLDGESVFPRTIGDDELEFRFSGEYITRSSEDVIVVEDGVITSSRGDPPYYHIRAKKIWVLGPGEWGLQGAVLYVGRIPVFYFPFFFIPGDELFFHPAAGYRLREGNFIQTTTYLIGRKQPGDSPVSFLQLADQGRERRRQERWGLFLRDTDEPDDTSPDRILKGIVDVYTRLGAYIGLQGSFARLGAFESLQFRLGMGMSRNIYDRGDGFFTSYREEDSEARSYWNRSRFLGTSVPFRYELETDFTWARWGARVQANVLLLSDPFLRRDFDDRAEEMDWAGFLGLGEVTDAQPEDITALDWRIRGTYSAPVSRLSPYVRNLGISNFLGTMSWENREIPSELLPSYVLEADRSPDRSFFYPTRSVFPDMTGRVDGTLVDTRMLGPPVQETEAEDQEEEEEDVLLLPPWPRSEREQQKEQDEELEAEFLDPDPFPRLPDPNLSPILAYTVSYSIVPRIVVENLYDTLEWNEPEDIDYALRYSTFSTDNTGRLNYGSNLYRRLLVLDNSIILRSRYRDLYNDERLEESVRNSLRLQTYQYTSFHTDHTMALSTYPLQDTDRFSSSNVTYRLNTRLYAREFDRVTDSMSPLYEDRYFEWNEEYVQLHRLDTNIRVRLWRAIQSLTLRTVLPPLIEEYSGDLELITGPLSTRASTKVRKPEDIWVWSPLTVQQELGIHDNVTFLDQFVYDIEEDELSLMSYSLRMWWLTGTIVYRNTPSYLFDPFQADPWIEQDDRALRPESAIISVDHRFRPEPLWKNRIRVATDIGSDLKMDLLRFTESTLDFRFGLNYFLHEFLDLRFQSVSQNDLVYLYVPELAEKTGRDHRDPVRDILQSFYVWDPVAREESVFKLKSLEISAIHYLDDWTFTVSYAGSPELVEARDGSQQYQWSYELSIFLVWRPIPEIRSNLEFNQDGWVEQE